MMNSHDYWLQREQENLSIYIKEETQYQKELNRIYQNMLDSCQKEIDSFYGKYAAAEGISIAEAKRRVSKLDIAAYERKAKRYVKEKDFSPKANEEMRLYNATMKINRLEMLKANIGLETIAGHDELEKFMGGILKGRTEAELKRQAGILGKTIKNNAQLANSIVNGSFRVEKVGSQSTFSDRIWQYQDIMRQDLGKLLQQGLIQGKGARAIAKDLKKYWYGNDPKTGGGAKYCMERLMRTELARVQTEAQKQSFIRNGFDFYEFIVNSGCCPICRGLNGKHFKVEKMMPGDNAPPMHPNCRCSTAAWEDDEEYEAWLDYLDKGGTTAEWEKTGKKEWEKLNKALENSKNIDTMKMSKIGIQFFAKMAKEKFLDYSLNPLKAPDKAKAFKEALGYTLDNYEDLMQNIKEHIDESKFVEKGDNGHGMLYEYIVRIKGPNGKSANVLTAWIQEGDEKRLVSVYVTERKVTE
jgi:SPP1 gp7 family putative phage head morphogenesis protein